MTVAEMGELVALDGEVGEMVKPWRGGRDRCARS